MICLGSHCRVTSMSNHRFSDVNILLFAPLWSNAFQSNFQDSGRQRRPIFQAARRQLFGVTFVYFYFPLTRGSELQEQKHQNVLCKNTLRKSLSETSPICRRIHLQQTSCSYNNVISGAYRELPLTYTSSLHTVRLNIVTYCIFHVTENMPFILYLSMVSRQSVSRCVVRIKKCGSLGQS